MSVRAKRSRSSRPEVGAQGSLLVEGVVPVHNGGGCCYYPTAGTEERPPAALTAEEVFERLLRRLEQLRDGQLSVKTAIEDLGRKVDRLALGERLGESPEVISKVELGPMGAEVLCGSLPGEGATHAGSGNPPPSVSNLAGVSGSSKRIALDTQPTAPRACRGQTGHTEQTDSTVSPRRYFNLEPATTRISLSESSHQSSLPGCESTSVEKVARCWSRACHRWRRIEEPRRHGGLADWIGGMLVRMLVLAVVVLDCVAVTCEMNAALTTGGAIPMPFIVLHAMFLSFYAVELALKIAVHREYFFIGPACGWHMLDLLMVTTSLALLVADANQSRMMTDFRWLRLLRLFLCLQTLDISCFARLNQILKSLEGSIASLFSSMVFLALILYLFASIFVSGLLAVPELSRTDEMLDLFGSTGRSMLTLYMAISGGKEWSLVFHECGQLGGLYPWAYLTFNVVVQIAILNIITSQFVEHAMSVSQRDRDLQALHYNQQYREQADDIRRIVKPYDDDGSGTISREEFRNVCENKEAMSKFRALGLDIGHVDAFFKMLADASRSHEVSTHEFVKGCMKMKGTATSLDMQTVLYSLFHLHTSISDLKKRLPSASDSQRAAASPRRQLERRE